MVGIVIVAHSEELARAIKVLTEQLVPREVRIAASGGIDDPEHPYGTDALDIQEAIASVYSDDGVVILMDMGSSLLSAGLAVELLPEEQRMKVLLCEAPLVEGAIAAAVCAAGGGTLSEVIAEACGALAAKASELGAGKPGPGEKSIVEELKVTAGKPQGQEKTAGSQKAEICGETTTVAVQNPLGIHARPAALFVTTAARFQAEVTVHNVSRNSGPVSAKSINCITMLDVKQGHSIAITASGPDAKEALKALTALVKGNFGEQREVNEYTEALKRAQRPQKPSPKGRKRPATGAVPPGMLKRGDAIRGIPASPGITIGPAFFLRHRTSLIPQREAEDPGEEWLCLKKALGAAEQQLAAIRTRVSVHAGEYEASIFDAHLLTLRDPALLESVREGIFTRRLSAACSWQLATDELIDRYRTAESPLIRLRGADLSDVKTRVLTLLLGSQALSLEPAEPSILLASDLSPSDTVRLDPEQIKGICTAAGGATSHSAILARALGIPMVVGAGPAILRLDAGTPLVLDGNEGLLLVDPAAIKQYREKQREWKRSRESFKAQSRKPAVTLDGRRIEVFANIGSAAEVKPALRLGAEGIGVLRTEFLFMGRINPPSEEEQLASYSEIAQLLGSRPFIIRVLDAGGDKPLPYLELPLCANPFLGLRGIRVLLKHPPLFKTQLRAVLRASPGHRIKLLFPMVSSVEEVRRAKAMLLEVKEELSRSSIPFDPSLEVGIMVEVPSAVATADRLATEVDFFSIGTNDLIQYVMAADRTNAQFSTLSDALQPALLRMIRQTVSAAREAFIRVGVCGEMAGDVLAVPVLLGLGIDELSMSPQAIPEVKAAIAKLTTAQAEKIARSAVEFDTAEEVREFVKNQLGEG